MSAISIFTCRPNSHPFQERQIPMHEPVKIGRSVARARPAPNNAIFDCKVLSRNHALIWYETGKFYLQDTKSSNGTFINNQRLSKGSEESPAREIYSGDIIQFGVDVMENSRRDSPHAQVTHGCIIAMVTLYHPDGREAKPSYTPNTMTGPALGANSQEIYQLAQYLQEALHREQMLENKLATLQRLVSNTQEASETGWQALIDEDRLLSRLEVLENQLQAYAKNQTEDNLRQELVALQEDKHKYENTAKESLRRVLQEKLEAVRKLSDLETSLSNTEDNCTHLKSMCELAQQELERLAGKHEETEKDMEELKQKLEEAEQNHEQEMQMVNQEKTELQNKLDEMMKQERELTSKMEAIEAEHESAKEELEAMKENLINKPPEIEKVDHIKNVKMESREIQVDLFVEKGEFEVKYDETETDSLKKKLKETQDQIEKYKAQMLDGETRLRDSKQKVDTLQNELDKAQLQQSDSVLQIVSLEEKLKFSDFHMSQMMDNTVADLQTQLDESEKQADKSSDLSSKLESQIEELEKQLIRYREDEEASRSRLIENNDDTNSNPINGITNHVETPTTSPMIPKLCHIEDLEKIKEDYSETIDRLALATDKICELEGLLCEARDAQKDSENEIDKFRHELDAARIQTKTFVEEAQSLRSQLEVSGTQVKDRMSQVAELQEQLSKTEASNKEVKQQITVLRDQLAEEQSLKSNGLEEMASLKKFLDTEREAHEIDRAHLESVQQQLLEAQQAAKHSKNEAEELRVRLKELEDEIDTEKNKSDIMKEGGIKTFEGPMSSDFSALKEECDSLRRRIQNIEADMKISKTENSKLSAENSHLLESYKELEKLKDCLESKESMWKHNLTDAQKEADNTKQELTEATAEIASLKLRVNQCTEEISHLKSDLDEMSEEYGILADRSRTLSACSMIPIIMLIFAIMLALYPTLATVTATTAPGLV
ncbi:sarcolemmal membrane-associated protein-like isoform X3 [Lineus longissimus]|uniref:sarcolemmal membrane-associated protein-like isoform X3 n=1 Tax=Lineus longissimus TaxID=88925 RepID=UPI00315D538A